MNTEIDGFVGSVADFEDGDRRAVLIDGGREVMVFRVGSEFYAYENVCPHQGGPACEGKLMPRVKAVQDAEGNVVRERFSEDEIHIVCPWHGWEFKVETGVCVPDPGRRLIRYEVVLKDGDVFVESRLAGVNGRRDA